MTSPTLDALLITKPEHIRYLTGTTSEGVVLVAKSPVSTSSSHPLWERGSKRILFTDARYIDRARAEVGAGVRVVLAPPDFDAAFRAELAAMKTKTLGFEARHVTVAGLAGWKKRLRGTGVTLTPTEGEIEKKRLVKSPAEIAKIQTACEVTSAILKKTLPAVVRGVTEIEIAEQIRALAFRAGAIELAFESIVAFGENAAIPHATPSKRKLRKGDVVLFDIGVKWDGYCADMSRTFFTAEPSVFVRSAYDAVLAAQLAGVANVRPCVRCAEVDAVVRSVLAATKYPPQSPLGKGGSENDFSTYFTHSTGHGVGLEIHEAPRLLARSDEVLVLGNVVTVEPGVYFSGDFGIRIEDTVVVEKGGARVLTPFPKKLTVLRV